MSFDPLQIFPLLYLQWSQTWPILVFSNELLNHFDMTLQSLLASSRFIWHDVSVHLANFLPQISNQPFQKPRFLLLYFYNWSIVDTQHWFHYIFFFNSFFQPSALLVKFVFISFIPPLRLQFSNSDYLPFLHNPDLNYILFLHPNI